LPNKYFGPKDKLAVGFRRQLAPQSFSFSLSVKKYKNYLFGMAKKAWKREKGLIMIEKMVENRKMEKFDCKI
jgi:hypothetical protein